MTLQTIKPSVTAATLQREIEIVQTLQGTALNIQTDLMDAYFVRRILIAK